ncbi:ArnT family glycosyltransferase [Actinacidiphila glaucinigra]|uniref:ArnT family glycosyltransferase n=1 Tax=Actinacidiphila glaucinigra TaxID=235986 RepID=UPI0035DCE181
MEPETNDARYAARQRWIRQPAAYGSYPPQEETYEDYGAHEAYPRQDAYAPHESYQQHEAYPLYESYGDAVGYQGHEPEPEPAYHVPESPEAGWDAAPSRRRDWVSRAILLAILAIQAVLSLRLDNTAFQDEALYLYAGHMEIAHLLHGTPTPIDYNTYFSGSPVLYPVLAAAVDGTFGLIGARLLSLAFMLGSTTLLYAFTRRMFNERVALVAAAMFAVTQSAIVMGNFATYDAAALFLLALTTWIVVRTDRAPIAAVLLAAPIGVLAVAVKYASALYLPTIVVLAVLTSWPHRKWRALLRGVLLALFVGGLILFGAKYTDVLSGVQQTTTNREHGTDSTWSLIEKSRDWGGLMFLTACGGLVSYIRRSRMNESPLSLRMSGPGWRWRTLLAVTLCGTALLAPAYQIHLHTSVSLFKHIGFGLLFAAPMAGIGVTRLVGAHFRYPQLGILVWVVMLCLGLSQSTWRFGVWADSSQLVSAVKPHVNKEGRYLAETYEVPIYYLRDRTNQRQWTSTFFISYQDKKGATHTGRDGYRQAIKDGYFDMVILDMVTTPEMDEYIAGQMKGSAHYRLLGNVPFKNSSGHGEYRIWIKQ